MCVGLFNAFQFEYKHAVVDRAYTPDDIDSKTKGIFWWWKWSILDASWMNYRISKPLGNCLVCMASVYSFIPYWWFNCWNFHTFESWAFYPFHIFAVAGLNALFERYIDNHE